MGGVFTRLFATYANILTSLRSTKPRSSTSSHKECSSTTARSAETPRYKFQDTNNFQFPNFNPEYSELVIGYWKLFVSWLLVIGNSALRAVRVFGNMLSPDKFSARDNLTSELLRYL